MHYHANKIKNINAITFDLDDTLWEIAPVIERAEKKVYELIQAKFPRVSERYALRDIQQIREQVLSSNLDIIHDLTEIRRLTFREMLSRCDYDPSQSSILLKQYMDWRHNIDFFVDVIPALELLSEQYQLMTITNGNADVKRLGISKYFSGSISAGLFGALKPDPRIFHHACEMLGEKPCTILHVGDNPTDDVIGSLDAGFHAAWINRHRTVWNEQRLPDIEIISLTELVEFLDGLDH